MRSAFARARRSPGVLAIVALAFAWALTMHDMGWAQLSNFAQVRALDAGRADIDPWHWETQDVAWQNGHFYSVKAPGLALVTTPVYSLLDAVGAESLSADAAANARDTPHPKWTPVADPPYRDAGFDRARAMSVERQAERETPLIWVLALFGAVLPALALLLSVRWAADRLVPGFGTAAAVTLGLGTIVMTFAAEYFSHIASATLAFGAFCVLFRERERGAESLRAVTLAGFLAGLAVTFEYPLGLVGAILLVYALGRGSRLSRAAAYCAAGFAGVVPLFAFNWWAFGSPLDFAYANAVAAGGVSGHAVLGLNDDGFFGITYPKPSAVVDLLISSRGILTLTPILAMGVAGAFVMRRGARRAEANVVIAITAVYFLYTSGYWLPFGGGTPGPRFLIPALPFLALGIAEAYRRLPALTLAMAVPSAVFMIAGAITFPLIGENGTQVWVDQLGEGSLEHTVLTAAGVSDPWVAIAPVLLLCVIAATLAVRASPSMRSRAFLPAIGVLCAWAVVSAVGPSVAGDTVTPLDDGNQALRLIAAAAGCAALALAYVRFAGPRPQPEPAPSELVPSS